MPKPTMTPREYALEKQRRINEGVFFFLYEKKKQWGAEESFPDIVIKSYVHQYKRTVACQMRIEQSRIKKNKIDQDFTRLKKRELPWEIEKQFIDKKQYILKLAQIDIPD